MANLDLTQYKSAGVYTIEIDDTVTDVTATGNSLRLLVGFNKKGPFNRPVLLASDNDRQNVFGNDFSLEHKGCYFNRFAKTMIPSSPIFALNLLNTDNSYSGADQTNYAAFSLDAGQPNPAVVSTNGTTYGEKDTNPADTSIYGNNYKGNIPNIGNAPFASFYDRSRFWIPAEDNVTAIAARGLNDLTETAVFNSANFLNIANVGTEELSILVFKPETLSGYNVTAKEWYGTTSAIPYKFIRPDDYISDYFIQVVIVKGNWSDAVSLSTDTKWSDYFDTKGIKKDKINTFISSSGITVLGSYIGSIIPEFTDKSGNNQNIITRLNEHTEVTGILASFNKDAAQTLGYDNGWYQDIDGDGNFESDTDSRTAPYLIDMCGHNFMSGYNVSVSDASGNITTHKRYGINFLSYNYDSSNTAGITSTVNFASYLSATGAVNAAVKNKFIIANDYAASILKIGDFVQNDSAEDTTLIPGLTRITGKTAVNITALSDSDNSMLNSGSAGQTMYKVTDASFMYNGSTYPYSGYVIYNSALKQKYFWVYTAIESVYINSEANSLITITDAASAMTMDVSYYNEILVADPTSSNLYTVKVYLQNDSSNAVIENNNDVILNSLTVSAKFSCKDPSGNLITTNYLKISNNGVDSSLLADNATFQTFDFTKLKIEGIYSDSSLATKVTGNTVTATFGTGDIVMTLDVGNTIVKQLPISDSEISGSLKWIPLKGLEITKRHLPGYDVSGNVNAEAGVEKIYSMLMNDTGIYRGLTNPNMIDFRYIVDSMGYGLGSMLGGKVYLSQLAAQRKSCTAIVNLPSKRQFASCTNPYFCNTFNEGNEVKPAFDTSYIPSGGNEELYHTKTFSMPDVDNGASYTATFWPWLQYTENGKTFNVPPAADVANVFIRKYTGSDPYMICANQTGILSNQLISGVEYAADQEDRDHLEGFGVNTIISQDGNVMIYGNQTAYQSVSSDLNKLHIRENMNTLELECKAILKNYVFTFNDATTRSDIVKNITPVLDAMVTSGAISSYDIETNANTDDIINESAGIIDISVYNTHGMEKLFARFTISRNSVSVS